MTGLAALLESLCLGDGGSLLCALCTWLNDLCVVLSMRLAVLIVAADIFGYLVYLSALRACLMVHSGCDLIFFDGDFCLCRVSYSLRWLLMSNGSCRQMNYWQVTWFCEND